MFTGSGIETVDDYLFGSMEMQIKLVPHNSAGTVTAYYVSIISSTSTVFQEILVLGNSLGFKQSI